MACRLTWPSPEIRAVAAGLLLQLLSENADKDGGGSGGAGGDSFAAGSGLLRLASARSPGGAPQLAGSGGASWRSSAAAPRGGGESLLRSLSRASSFQGGASFRSSATYAAARRDPRQLEAARKILKGVQLGRVPTTADVLSVLAQVSCPAGPACRRLRLPGARGRNAARGGDAPWAQAPPLFVRKTPLPDLLTACSFSHGGGAAWGAHAGAGAAGHLGGGRRAGHGRADGGLGSPPSPPTVPPTDHPTVCRVPSPNRPPRTRPGTCGSSLTPPLPSLLYKVDTSRPSPRTKRARLVLQAATHKTGHVRQLAADALDRCQPATSRAEGASVSPLDPFLVWSRSNFTGGETCPVSTGGGTRLVRLVRGRGGGEKGQIWRAVREARSLRLL